MTLSRAHTSAKAADVAKLLLLNKRQVYTYLPMWSMTVRRPNRNPNSPKLPSKSNGFFRGLSAPFHQVL